MGNLATIPKIGKCLRLLSSPEDGEKLAAIAALDRTLKSMMLDFNDLAAATEAGLNTPATPRPKAPGQPMSELDKALWVRDRDGGTLTDHERDFIASAIRILAYGNYWSAKQQRWLDAIFLAMGGKNG